MKKQIFATIAMFGLWLTLAAASAQAQSRTRIEATIPFDFTAAETNLPAGVYSVKFVSHNALLLRSADGRKSAMIVAPRAIAGNAKTTERMVFHRYGNRYFLAQIWMLRSDSGRELYPSNTELRLAKEQQVSKKWKPERVEISATAR